MSSSINQRKTIARNKATVSPTQKLLSKRFEPKRPYGQTGICLVIWTDAGERIRAFELSGHAGFAEAGQDIVCAGVSALSIAACNGLEYFLPAAFELQTEEGLLSCRFAGAEGQELEKAQWILRTMILGIEQIQTAYNQKYIVIEQRRWTPC